MLVDIYEPRIQGFTFHPPPSFQEEQSHNPENIIANK